jgi:hypothetical protein
MFTQSVVYGMARWSDYGSDGDLDVVVSGLNAVNYSEIYRNVGGNFISGPSEITPIVILPSIGEILTMMGIKTSCSPEIRRKTRLRACTEMMAMDFRPFPLV